MSKSSKPESAALSIRVVPRSSQNRVEWVDPSTLKVWVSAAPVDGEANRAICELIAKALHLPKSAVEIRSGEMSRNKQISVIGIGESEVKARLLPSKSA